MKHITVGLDFTPEREAVLETASGLAQALGAELLVLHVCAPDPDFVGYAEYTFPGEEEREEELRDEAREIRKIVRDLHERGLSAKGYMRTGRTVETIVEFARRHDSAFIVVGQHGHGLMHRVILGSISQGVVHHSSVPVVVVPASE